MKEITTCPVCGNSSLATFLSSTDYAVSREAFLLLECTHCELLITQPQPTESELEKYYQFEEYVSHTSKGNNVINRIYLLVRRYTLSQKLNLINTYSEKGRLLDVGCGTGNFMAHCIKYGWNAEGVEPSSTARHIAGALQSRIYPTLEAHVETGYNAITLWHVLEHLPHLNESIDQLKAKLANNGTLYIAVPNYQCYDAGHYQEYWAAYDLPRHLWHFSKNAVKKLLEKKRLDIIDIKPMKFDSYYVSLLSEKYKAGRKLTLSGAFNALKTGFISNYKATSKHDYSSLIYIVKK